MPPTCQKTKNIKNSLVAFMATPEGRAFYKKHFPNDNEPSIRRRAANYIGYVVDLNKVNKWRDFAKMLGLSNEYENLYYKYSQTAQNQLNAEADLMDAEVSVSDDDDDDDDDDATEDSDKMVPYVPEEGGGQVGKDVIDLTSPDGTKKGEWKNGKFQTQEVEDDVVEIIGQMSACDIVAKNVKEAEEKGDVIEIE